MRQFAIPLLTSFEVALLRFRRVFRRSGLQARPVNRRKRRVWRPVLQKGTGFVSVLLVVVFGVCSARANVTLAKIFADHAVLQRDLALPVWGTAEPGEKVTVKLGAAQATATADARGTWSVKLPAMQVNAVGQNLTVSGTNTITVKDVLIGDVWLCGGQSNMEMSLDGCSGAKEDIAAASFPTLRLIKINLPNRAKPSSDDVVGPWEVCTPTNAGGFTGVGFYFARRIQQETGVPIGLLEDCVGGTRIELWIPSDGFALEPAARVPAENEDAQRLYRGMIKPVVPFGIKGAIWYQGEWNHNDDEMIYYHKMRALIAGWRKVWNQGDFPFYFVQLHKWWNDPKDTAHGKPDDYPSGDVGLDFSGIRMAQMRCLQIPNTGMPVSIDTGKENLHPGNKFDVGERLALWALRDHYGKKDLVVSGPLYKAMKVEGNKIRIRFDHLGSGLMVGKKVDRNPTEEDKDGKLRRFAIAGQAPTSPGGSAVASNKWVWAEAVIDGEDVVVSSPDLANPVAVRYACSMNPEGCNLYNKEGLPASPFHTNLAAALTLAAGTGGAVPPRQRGVPQRHRRRRRAAERLAAGALRPEDSDQCHSQPRLHVCELECSQRLGDLCEQQRREYDRDHRKRGNDPSQLPVRGLRRNHGARDPGAGEGGHESDDHGHGELS